MSVFFLQHLQAQTDLYQYTVAFFVPGYVLHLTVSVPVVEPGPPSPPDSVTVEEVTDSTAQLAWTHGRDNGSPITSYFIQTRTPFTVGWQRVNTGRGRLQVDFPLRPNVMIISRITTGMFSDSGEVREQGYRRREGVQVLTQEDYRLLLLLLYGVV